MTRLHQAFPTGIPLFSKLTYTPLSRTLVVWGTFQSGALLPTSSLLARLVYNCLSAVGLTESWVQIKMNAGGRAWVFWLVATTHAGLVPIAVRA
jgi:hypothetical protein